MNDVETLADLAIVMAAPVVLVVGLRLGCLNHALLTAEAVRADGLTLAGWVAKNIDPAMACRDHDIATLCDRLPAPLLNDGSLAEALPENALQQAMQHIRQFRRGSTACLSTR